MKTKSIFAVALAATITLSTAALAQEFTKGKVKKVDAEAKKVTLIHEPLKNLDMPGMTMVFRVEDPTLLAKIKQGSEIEFVADRVNGKLGVTQVK